MTRKPDNEKVRIALKRATAKYKPRGYPGRIVLFRAIDQGRYESADDLGWTEVAEGGLEIHDIPGNHTTMFVQAGAEKLAACIQAALSRNAGGNNRRKELAPAFRRNSRSVAGSKQMDDSGIGRPPQIALARSDL